MGYVQSLGESGSASTSWKGLLSMATHRVGWLFSGGVGRLVRANYVAFFSEDGEQFNFLAVLFREPKSRVLFLSMRWQS